MKKFLFSLSMVAALSLAVFTTSCGGDDDNGNILPQPPEYPTAEYTSSLNVVAGDPDEIEAGLGKDLGTITEDVKIVINSSSNTIDLSIKGINLGELANIPPWLQAPFDIELQNVPYTNDGNDVYTIAYTPNFNPDAWTGDVAININGDKAYLISLVGSVDGDNLQLTFFVLGDKNLANMSVNIFVNGTKK